MYPNFQSYGQDLGSAAAAASGLGASGLAGLGGGGSGACSGGTGSQMASGGASATAAQFAALQVIITTNLQPYMTGVRSNVLI